MDNRAGRGILTARGGDDPLARVPRPASLTPQGEAPMHPFLSRRQLLKGAAAGAAALFVLDTPLFALQAGKGQTYPFKLPDLPYPAAALEPHIDARTMEIHHDRHHKAYVDNLNNALKPFPTLHKVSLNQLVSFGRVPDEIKTAVRNNAGGHFNHSLFWH